MVFTKKGNFVIVASFPFQKRLGTYDAGFYPHCRLTPASQYERAGRALVTVFTPSETRRRITSPLKYNKDTHSKP